MLGMIYNLLPSINDDYAAKVVYTLENKKDVFQLQKDIADILGQLASNSPVADTLVAKILLDEITLPAAAQLLHIDQNALSIEQITKALEIPHEDTVLLINYYATLGADHFFDVSFSQLFAALPKKPKLDDKEKARQVIHKLIEQAKQDLKEHPNRSTENKKAIYQLADRYHLSLQNTAALLNAYTTTGAGDIASLFDTIFQLLQKINDNPSLNASLTAKTLLSQITPKDAQEITLTSKLLNGQILEDDLIVIACRYLKVKTPKDIADTFQAVLQRLPHVRQEEENLGLAVRVLLDGTEPMFEKAQQKAALERSRLLLRKELERNELFAGYEDKLAQRFAGQKEFPQVEKEMQEVLKDLPYCQNAAENKELACKMLLGTLSREEACKQAEYLRDLKAKTLTKGLAPRVLKNYLGTKSAEEIIGFFEQSLTPYTFWKSNQQAHEFALQALVGELNGTSNARISAFVLDMLESGSSLELLGDMLANIQAHKTSADELDALLERYKNARSVTKEN